MSFINTSVMAEENMKRDLEMLLANAPPSEAEVWGKYFQGFQMLFSRFLAQSDVVSWDLISPIPEEAVIRYSELQKAEIDSAKLLLDKLVVVKLNGGLGTTMGCKGPKSLIPVRNNFSFLDLNIHQIEYLNNKYGCQVPLVLMNSFSTHKATEKMLRKYAACNVPIYCFEQSQYPRIQRDSLRPLAIGFPATDNDSWYPPGHGDFYESFYNSGLLQKFLNEGRECIFVSNIDNLGATPDLYILNGFLNADGSEPQDFFMEVTDKTRADIKGGTLISYGGKIRLLEMAQVPSEHMDDFKSVSKFKVFNTNNLWIKLQSIQHLVESKGFTSDVIVNTKTLDDGTGIIQLETAIGAAMKNFSRALGVNVPRSRFLPVKNNSDMLLVMSNLYVMRNGTLCMSPDRQFLTTPYIQLCGNQFKSVKEFLSRFASVPDILDLDHLTVSGDVTFGRNVVLKGTVIIIANHGNRIDIPPHALLENKIISGNLRILDH